jgi:hypothetical protein
MAAQVTVSEARGGELSAGGDFEKGEVVGVAQAEGAKAPASIGDGAGDCVEEV